MSSKHGKFGPKSDVSADAIGIYLILVAMVIITFATILRIIINVSRRNMKEPTPKLKPDKFSLDHKYTWDYVFVFKVWDEFEREAFHSGQTSSNMKFIIDRLLKGGLETRCFYSAQRDEVYVKIRCSPQRLKQEAARIKYPLQFDKERLRIKLQSGRKVDGKQVWAPVNITDDFKVSDYEYNDFIYGKYDLNPEVQSLYRTYHGGLIFRGVDRIKLIVSIIEAKQNMDNGCGLNLNELALGQDLLAAFAIHDYELLRALEASWLQINYTHQPLTEIKDYFGEKVGMYFLYLDHYFRQLAIPSVLGFTSFVLDRSTTANSSTFFAFLMIFWGFVYTEYWKRTQVEHAMMWGVFGFDKIEQNRSEFAGETIQSPIHGSSELYFPVKKKRQRIAVSNLAVCFSILVVFGFVILIFLFTIILQSAKAKATLTIAGLDVGTIIASLVNAVIIQILNFVYQFEAIIVTDYENHQTDTTYEDHLIAKVFCFQIINCYASICFVAYIKPYIGGVMWAGIRIPVCKNMDCTNEVATILGTIFISRLVLLLFLEIFLPMMKHSYKEAKENADLEPGVEATPIEKQYTLAEFDILKDTLKDYSELIIHYGYILLFVAAFPLVPAIAFVAGYILIRINGWKYCQIYRRPDPKSAEDIGTWLQFLELITTLAITTNLGLIIFTSSQFVNYLYTLKWIAFIILEHFILFISYLIKVVIPDVPFSVNMQLERQTFIVGKVLLNIADDADDAEEKIEMSHVNHVILPTDKDWENFQADDVNAAKIVEEQENVVLEGLET